MPQLHLNTFAQREIFVELAFPVQLSLHVLPELEATQFINACTWLRMPNNQPLTRVCPWASGLGVRPAQVADVHWTN